ncbi:hypothetical protein EaACW_2349 [Erwinia amylovora ACW56400]|nr:hypothetical protein AD997_11485 [Erwinia amylovora]EKV53345.1 hypothetical protein EaACW_2349 [Erwinia amylovora ACW56400]CCO79193.1 hypothetical protein BN432_2406 [Erwinia amylovora Ea356]CCO90556.1 hypothetical protein BN435_2397 [Erwinia amylovora 01SFR-BO]CCO99670.1 hypothetical protein BN438_2398 [Erwinia amylovora UPN527]
MSFIRSVSDIIQITRVQFNSNSFIAFRIKKAPAEARAVNFYDGKLLSLSPPLTRYNTFCVTQQNYLLLQRDCLE